MAPEHLNDRQLAEYARGQTPPDALLATDDHLAECAGCRARLGALSSPAPILDWQGGIADLAEQSLHLTYEQLTAPADTLPDGVREHLRECASCREEIQELQPRTVRQPQPIRPPQPVRKPFPAWKWLAPLATAAAVIGVAFLWRPAAAPPKPAALVEIRDAGGSIALRADHALEVPPSIPATDRDLLAQVLEKGTLAVAPIPADVQTKNGTLLGPSTADAFAPLAPLGVITVSDRPEFRWQAIAAGAEWYCVQVYDSSFNEVASSGRISQTSWTPAQPLPRGRLYQWQISARTAGREIHVPTPPAREARFRVLDAAAAARIESARAAAPVSHLLVAALCAPAGLRDEARAALDRLAADNPSSAFVSKLTAALQ